MDDSRTSKTRSAKLGPARGSNREKLAGTHTGLGNQVDKPTQSNVPAMKRKLQKTAGPSLKAHSTTYNLRSKDQLTLSGKDSPVYNLRSKVQKTEVENVSTSITKRKSPKLECSKDSLAFKNSSVALQKNGISKISAPSVIKSDITKPSTTYTDTLDQKNEPLTSQYELLFREPMYHIRWEGDEDMEIGPFGQNCIICNKDLSGVTEDDNSESNDDDQYEDDDDDDGDDDDGYNDDDVIPALLPAVDILPCGHAYHTECLQQGTPQEPSSDPKCTFCSKMA